jgi:hypothetical protein
MKTVDLPQGSITEFAEKLAKLSDAVLMTDKDSVDGYNARKIYRLAVKVLEIKAAIENDDQIRALLYDTNERLEGCQ